VTRSISALKRLERIRVGLLGDDQSALDDHLAVLNILPDYEPTAFHQLSPESNRASPGQFAPEIRTAKELTSHPDVDLVAVVGASPLARDHVRDAIAAGKDVFCDLHVLSDAKTAHELADLVERSRISDVVGLFPRASQATRYVGDLLADSFVRKVCSVRLYANLAGAKASLPTSFPNSVQSISPIAELAVQFLDALFSIVGRPRQFSSVVGSRDTPGEGPPTAVRRRELCAIGVLEGDGVFSAHFDEWSGPPAVQIDIAGDGGKLKIEAATNYNGENVAIEAFRQGDDRPYLLTIPRSYKWISSQQFSPRTAGLANLYASFARDLHEGTHRTPTIDDAIKMLELLQLTAKA
jgi:predicted dehydrogenase